jgi:hypothetical protein
MFAQSHFLRAVPATAIFAIPIAECSSIFDRDLISLDKFIDGVESTGFADNLRQIGEAKEKKCKCI